MERLTFHARLLAVLLVVVGAYVYLAPQATYSGKTEKWMEQHAPKQVGDFVMIPGQDNPEVTYRMNEYTYNELKPYGIVARVFDRDGEQYDAVVVASRRHESFHDPRVCFTAQNWSIEREESAIIKTKTRGDVPVTVAEMLSSDPNKRRTRSIAVFFYRGPTGFHPTTLKLKWGMFVSQFRGNTDIDGVFYRIIPVGTDPDKQRLFEFIAAWLDEANETSGGYF